eukprot:CAMPEP_0185776080 /NCGR_PEP_ID=MMETSP1174-20130828/84355_1 /TAXON_ID=35687 /ORGANISM="Dictyocha speculum, Strain CCMP1381" /LENGTH=62 /DNA_ID=CAMNT_0028463869 /DNA_START=224 /DNA_END=412 /DNA_ORIENTATION=-
MQSTTRAYVSSAHDIKEEAGKKKPYYECKDRTKALKGKEPSAELILAAWSKEVEDEVHQSQV